MVPFWGHVCYSIWVVSYILVKSVWLDPDMRGVLQHLSGRVWHAWATKREVWKPCNTHLSERLADWLFSNNKQSVCSPKRVEWASHTIRFFIVFNLLPGDLMANTIPCKWTSDQCKIVLEMPSETSKACKDAEPCTIRNLLQEFEESNVVDVSLHQHSCERPGAEDTSGSFYQTVVTFYQTFGVAGN